MHKLRRRRSRGYSLLEILVVLAIIGLISSVVAVALFRHFVDARIQTTRQSAMQVRTAVLTYRMQAPSDACPTVDALVDDQLIDGNRTPVDAWDQPFTIDCDERGGIVVTSAGPDKRKGTPDDIIVPVPRAEPRRAERD